MGKNKRGWRCPLVWLALALLLMRAATADDAVYLTPESPGGPLVRVRGQIVEFTGNELRIENEAGQSRAVPASRVARIEFTRSPEQAAGDEHFANREWQPALAAYQQALAVQREPRQWVRRQILAQAIWCHRNLGQWDAAGELFLTLLASDPATQYFDCIPLFWTEDPPSADVIGKAQPWLADTNQPAAVLMGASLLVDSPSRPAALAGLRTLLASPDSRIVWLAYAQLWRAGANNATDAQRRLFAARIETSDATLRAGPYFVLGRSLLQAEPQAAAILLMHVPIEFPRESQLAASALLLTAQALESLQRPEQAMGLYREIAAGYSETQVARQAEQQLERLGVSTPARDMRPPTTSYLDGLRARRLYELAERACEDQLTGAELTDLQRNTLAVELIRTLTEHARAVSPGEALPLWQRASEVAQAFAQKYPQSPRLVLVRLQEALARLAEGEAARYDAHEDYGSPAMETARRILRSAIAQLEEVAKLVATGLRQQTATRMTGDELTVPEWQSLELNVHLEMARALRNQAECYPPTSADRINSLTRAGEALATLSRHTTQNLLFWRAALETIARLRLLGDLREADKQLEAASALNPPAVIAQQLRAERIRLALARGSVDDALAEAGTAADRAASPELDFARLEAFLAAWRRETDRHKDAAAAEWQRRAVEQAADIRRAYGGPWMRRSDSLLATTIAGSGGSQSFATLAFSAAGFYRSGDLAKAVEAFDQAAKKAREEQLSGKALEASFAAATIEKERGQYAEALRRYQQIATDWPDSGQAASAHLMAAFCAGQLAQAQKPPRLDDYKRMLAEHVAKWPESETASQAYSWLGRLAEHERNWPQAVDLLAKVRPADPQYGEAVEALARSYAAWLAETRAAGGDTRPIADRALGALEHAADRDTKPDAATRAAALAAGKLWLTELAHGALPAERLLRSAYDNDPQAPAAWRQELQRWLIPALVIQGKGGQADALLDELAGARQQLALLDTIIAVRRRQSDDDARAKLAQFELDVETHLLEHPNELDGDALRAVRRSHALTLAETGRRQQGLEELQQLAREFPRDGQTHEELATLLAAGNAADRELALTIWTGVVRKSRPGTARWLRASAGLAATQLKLGQRVEAQATIRQVLARFPSLDGEFKARFDALSAEAGG